MIDMLRLNVISKTSRTISIEIENDECFYTKNAVDVYLNCKKVFEIYKNVFTLECLKSSSKYTVYVQDRVTNEKSEEMCVMTENETAELNVMDFGAAGDGKHNDTNFIQSAIAACPQNGVVYFPKGEYVSSPLFLKSNMTIEFQKGSVLIGDRDRENYPVLKGTVSDKCDADYYLSSWEGHADDCYASLLTGIDVKNVCITGEGVIDGNAGYNTWWHEPKVKRKAWRPKTIFLNRCENILIEGISIKNSPSWTIHPLMCKNLKIIDVDVENPKDAPNTDGFDPESCKDVYAIGDSFSVGDDCIAIKAGKYETSRKYPVMCENIIIRNCIMEYGHGAVVIGSEMSCGVKGVTAEKCVFKNTDRGIRIKTRRGRGGIIDGICADNLVMENVSVPFTVNCFYFCDADGKSEYVWSKGKLPIDDRTPYIGHISLKNIICKNAKYAAGFMYGLPERKIECVDMENIDVDFGKCSEKGYAEMMSGIGPMERYGFYLNNIKLLKMKDVSVKNQISNAVNKFNIG